MRRVFAASAALLSLAFFTVAIVASGAQAGPSRPQVTNITLSGWSAGKDEDDLLQGIVDTFNRTHPAIHVNYSIINGDYPTAMTARFAAHNPPDVFYVDSSVAPTWIKQGVLQPLNAVHQEEQVRRHASSTRACSAPSRSGRTTTASRRTGRRSRRRSTSPCSRRRASGSRRDLGRARGRRPEARVVERRPGRQAGLLAGRLGTHARVRLPEQGLAREGAVPCRRRRR